MLFIDLEHSISFTTNHKVRQGYSLISLCASYALRLSTKGLFRAIHLNSALNFIDHPQSRPVAEASACQLMYFMCIRVVIREILSCSLSVHYIELLLQEFFWVSIFFSSVFILVFFFEFIKNFRGVYCSVADRCKREQCKCEQYCAKNDIVNFQGSEK